MADAHKDYVDEILGDWAIQEEPTEDLRPMEGGELLVFPRKGNVADEALTDADLIDDEPGVINDHLFHKLALGGHDGAQPLGNAYNAGLVLQADHRLAGLLGYDEFRQQTVVLRSLDTGVDAVPSISVRNGGEPLQDHHLDALMAFMQAPSEIRGEVGGHGCGVTRQALEAGISNAARKNPFNPVLNMIGAQAWDGVPRIDGWLVKYLGCPDDVYHRQIGRNWLIGAVARASEPGTKFDYVLTIVGPQGVRKSTVFEVLGGEFYTALGAGAMKEEKKLIEATQGSWIVEIAEMAAMKGTAQESIKNILSTTVDRSRLAYAKLATDHKRHFVFSVTTNNVAMLDDPTGGRRYWIAEVVVKMIDTGALAAEVGQLWAEAANAYRRMREGTPVGHLPLFLSPEAEEIAKAKQGAARAYDDIDALEDDIREFIETPKVNGDGLAYGHSFYTEMSPKQIFAEITGRPATEYASGKIARNLVAACRRIDYLTVSDKTRVIRRTGERSKSIIVDRERFLPHFAEMLRETKGVDISRFDENGDLAPGV